MRLPLCYIGGDVSFFTDALNSLGGNGLDFAPAYGYGTVSPNPNPAPQNYGGWGMSIYGGGLGVRQYGDLGSINGPNLNSGSNWRHLVHVIDRKAGTITTYLDGAPAHYAKIAGTVLKDAGNINV